MPFQVAAKYGRGPEQQVARFNDQNEAKVYIQKKLEADAGLKVNVTYLLYDMGELVATFEPGSHRGADTQSGAESGGSSGGQQQSSSFRPSPLQTSPRPTGMPPSSFRDLLKDDGDEKKK